MKKLDDFDGLIILLTILPDCLLFWEYGQGMQAVFLASQDEGRVTVAPYVVQKRAHKLGVSIRVSLGILAVDKAVALVAI